jgi:hypothetical protein
MKSIMRINIIPSVLALLAISPMTQAVTPSPDGGYPGGNTAEGQNALFSLTSGTYNTAIGWFSLRSNTQGQFNTAVGAGTLLANLGDPTSGDGTENTAIGTAALLSNTTGASNTANGAFALFRNIDGSFNNAVGDSALFANISGLYNNALGRGALEANVGGSQNNAFGDAALEVNVSGSYNTAVGDAALGFCTGNSNVAVGDDAGAGITTGSNIIAIGAGVLGVSTSFGQVDNSCYVGNIQGATVDAATAASVFVDADGKLGTLPTDVTGSKVTVPNFAQPQTMFNEFLKQQRRIAELEDTVARLSTMLGEQAMQIEKVIGQLRAGKPAPNMVLNNQ